MRLLLWIPRAPHLKILGSVAAEATRRGHDVLAVAPAGDVKGGDALIHARGELGSMVPVTDRWRLTDFRPHWALAVGLRTAPTLRRLTRRRGVRWCALDHCGDNLSFLLEGESTNGWDAVSLLSVEGARLAGSMTEGVACQGYPELDQLTTVVGDRAACRAKWNLPQDQHVLFFGTAACPIRLGRVRRWWFEQMRYWRIVRILRQWADEHGAFIVAKTRAKHRDPAWLLRYADKVVGDVSFYPFTTLELLRAADLYVGFASAMAIEACAVGIPQVHLYGWPPEWAEWPSGWPFKREFFLKAGGLWNCPGSVAVACWGDRWWQTVGAHLDAVPLALMRNGTEFMQAACERWAGPLDGQASSRVLDLLEA